MLNIDEQIEFDEKNYENIHYCRNNEQEHIAF